MIEIVLDDVVDGRGHSALRAIQPHAPRGPPDPVGHRTARVVNKPGIQGQAQAARQIRFAMVTLGVEAHRADIREVVESVSHDIHQVAGSAPVSGRGTALVVGDLRLGLFALDGLHNRLPQPGAMTRRCLGSLNGLSGCVDSFRSGHAVKIFRGSSALTVAVELLTTWLMRRLAHTLASMTASA